MKTQELNLWDSVIHEELNTSKGGLWKAIETELRPKMMNEAMRSVGVRSGRLRQNIRWYHMGNFYGQFFGLRTDLRYGLLHHEGTKPHVIIGKSNSRTGGMLVFRGSTGGVVRKRAVNHPGTGSNPFLRRTLSHVRRF